MTDAGLVALAAQAQMRTALYVVLRGCAQRLGTPVSPDVLSALAPSRWRAKALARLLLKAEGGLPTSEVKGWAKFLLQLLLLDEPRHAPLIGLQVMLPATRWIQARYGVRGRAVWRYRLTHALSVLRRGEL